MQYIYENFTFPPDQSFTIRSDFLEIKKYHQFRCHENYEITLIENCIGKRFIGDHIEEFESPELVLMASFLPHCWQYYQAADPFVQSHAIIVHFFPDFLGKEILEIPEAQPLATLFSHAAKGISFSGSTITEAKMILKQMLYETGLARISLMLRLLDILAQSKTYKVLSSPGFNIIESSSEAKKINAVFDYIFKNFKGEITLQNVAATIPMSTAAFCRFFKTKTNRTLTDFIKEIRIGHAAKLLLEGNHNVSEASFESGYNNISNFNKHFREVKGCSPREFLKGYRENEN